MIKLSKPFKIAGFGVVCGLAFATAPHAGAATEVKNISAPLRQLIAAELAANAGKTATNVVVPGFSAANPGGGLDLSDAAIRDEQGRIRVTILLKTPADRADVVSLPSIADVEEDMSYRGGVVEAYLSAVDIASLARKSGVSAVHLVNRPVLNVGATTSHGVVQHRVDQIAAQPAPTAAPGGVVTGITGAGITVGVLSDSYNAAPASAANPKANLGVATGDLPGPGNVNNPTPVRVLDDPFRSTNTDEGRGMAEIVHDMAPKANIAFATAFGGETGFANNIRRLAAPITEDPATSGAAAQVIVDDVGYLTEPMFSDGIIARAVDDVYAQGVSYYSSAGNRPATNGYSADFRFIPNGGGNTAAENISLTNTNLNLANVPPHLYAGGFHDFNPAPGAAGLDVAQLCTIAGTSRLPFQWDDPFDQSPVTVGAPFASGTGAVAPNGFFDFTFNGTEDQRVQISVFGTDNATPTTPDSFDAIVDVFGPDNQQIAHQDTGNREDLLMFLPATGTYRVRVTQFGTQTGGSFNWEVKNASGAPLITNDFNILFFRSDGSYIGAVGEDNITTNRPVELASINPAALGITNGQLQIVIARSNTPPVNVTQAKRLKYVSYEGPIEPAEYFSFQSLYGITYGHSAATGANSVAAYAFYPPFIPETFTSPGTVLIAFDKQNNRLATPETRLRPNIAAMDGANNTFFGSDAGQDPDAFPNFFGTSASAPHAASIAALVLEAKGGPGSVTPEQMRTMLQRSAFAHDLDPYRATATLRAGTSRLTIVAEANSSTPGINGADIFSVNYVGAGSLTQFVLNPQGTKPTAGNTTEPTGNSARCSGTSAPGIVFDTRTPSTPGSPFKLGVLRGVVAADISAATSNPAPPPAVDPANQRFTLAVNINFGQLVGGEGFNFGIERDEADAYGSAGTVGGDPTDLLGANVSIPSGVVAPGGMTVSGSNSVGGQFSGVFVNRIGNGYSPLDGFGFINAQSAVNQPIP